VKGFLDWSEYSVWENIPNFPMNSLTTVSTSIKKLSYALGALDVVGLTAYFGIQEISKPKEGETILISSAAGGVGSIAGQIAKIQGAKVIGLTTTKEKLDTLVNKLGFDAALDYKSPEFANELKQLIPEGPDIYFDNVGGELSQTIMNQMKRPARVTECGQISAYNEKGCSLMVDIRPIHSNGLRFEGFHPMLFVDQFPIALKHLYDWIDSGKIIVLETEWTGLESAPKAIVSMFSGKGIGKHIVTLGN
jgi:NADPH-dependent curcumin reductase CurA